MIDAARSYEEEEVETRRPVRGARRGRRTAPITLKEMQDLRMKAAIIVQRYGETYLPIFDRFDQECTQLERRQASLSRVEQFAAPPGGSPR